MKKTCINLISIFILLNCTTVMRSEIIEVKQVPQMNCGKKSMSDVVVRFIYNHSFLCFIGMWLYSENIFKAFIGALIAKGLSHEYLDMYNVPHGFCPKQYMNLLLQEIISNDEKIIITDSVSIVV